MATVKSVVVGELFLFGEQSKAFLKTREYTSMDCEGWLSKIMESKCLFPICLLTCSTLLVICMPCNGNRVKSTCESFTACINYLSDLHSMPTVFKEKKKSQNIYSVTRANTRCLFWLCFFWFRYFHPACVLKYLLSFFLFNLEELSSNRLRSVHVSGWCILSWNTENSFDKRLSTELQNGWSWKGPLKAMRATSCWLSRTTSLSNKEDCTTSLGRVITKSKRNVFNVCL